MMVPWGLLVGIGYIWILFEKVSNVLFPPDR